MPQSSSLPSVTVGSFLIFALVLPLAVARAQGGGTQPAAAGDQQSPRARDLSLQFAVPSSPAFSLVGVEKTAILRPTAFHELSTAASSFTSGSGGFALPKELGLEFAPWFVARGRTLTLDEYRKHPILYKLRLSGGVKRGADTLGATALSLGLRFSIMDRADPRLDPQLVESLTLLTTAINSACGKGVGPPGPDAVPGVADCADPRGDVKRLTTLLASLPAGTSQAKKDSVQAALKQAKALADARKRPLEALSASVDLLKKNWLAQSWNRPALDIAFAASANTRDSLGRDPKVDVLATWVSGALPVGQWGQVVYGASGRNARDSVAAPRRWSGGFGAGLYLGSNEFKGYAEARGTWQRDTKTVAEFVAGSELKLFAGLWGQGSVGWSTDAQSSRGRLISRLTVRTSFPQLTATSSATAPAATK